MINDWEQIKKTSRFVNRSFQSQLDNSQMQLFANSFVTKNDGDILNFGIKLIHDKNKEIEFGDREKKIHHCKFFDWFFSMNRIDRKKTKKSQRNILKTC